MPTRTSEKLRVVVILGNFQLMIFSSCPIIKRITLPQNWGLCLSFCVFKCFSKWCFVVSMKFWNCVLRQDICRLGHLPQQRRATPLVFVGFAEACGEAYAKTAIFRWKTSEWAFLSYNRHVLDIFQTGAPHSAHCSGWFLGTRVGQW